MTTQPGAESSNFSAAILSHTTWPFMNAALISPLQSFSRDQKIVSRDRDRDFAKYEVTETETETKLLLARETETETNTETKYEFEGG